jgi:hypothetical protein
MPGLCGSSAIASFFRVARFYIVGDQIVEIAYDDPDGAGEDLELTASTTIAGMSAPSNDGNRISHSVTDSKAHNCHNQKLNHGRAPLFE